MLERLDSGKDACSTWQYLVWQHVVQPSLSRSGSLWLLVAAVRQTEPTLTAGCGSQNTVVVKALQ